MSANRTVFWLAVLTAIIPFLAIPEWIIKTAVAVLAFSIIITTRIASSKPQAQAFQPPQIGNRDDDGLQDSGTTKDTQKEDTASKKETENQDQKDPVDITDPDADTMVASGQWRRRSSRDLSDDKDL